MNHLVFGDVHGDLKSLSTLCDKAIQMTKGGELTLHSVGDLIDRGENSMGVIEFCIQNKVNLTLGNHELWLHQWCNTGKFDTFALHRMVGGKATLKSYGIESVSPSQIESELAKLFPNSHREYLTRAAVYSQIVHEGVKYRLTHSGVEKSFGEELWGKIRNAGVPEESIGDTMMDVISLETPSNILWTEMKKDRMFSFPDGSVQVFGHTPWGKRGEINTEKGYAALDTGCGTCPPYNLTGMLLMEGEKNPSLICSRNYS
jgi:hypothetical protein